MDPKIKTLIEKIDELNKRLGVEYQRLAKKYGFSFVKKRIIFFDAFRIKNKSLKIPAWKYAIPQNIRHIASIPFIYMVIIPAVILDIFITVYHWGAFPLYGIPKVKRSDYIKYDRRFLDYLNIIQKANCLYCSYVNGLFAYSVEIAARTERYWCPIKAASKPSFHHDWYKDFADYGNPEEWNEKFNDLDAFKNEKISEKKYEKERTAENRPSIG